MTKPRKAVDQRVRRTQSALRAALLELIGERGWDEVTVQAVCDRARVGRSTFYAHYADKEELLLSGFDSLLDELRAHVQRASAVRPGTHAPSPEARRGDRSGRTAAQRSTRRDPATQALAAHADRRPASLAFVAPLVAHVAGHRRLYRALVGKRTVHQMRRRLLSVIASLLEGEAGSSALKSARQRAGVRYIAGACVELLGYWLDERSGLDARDIEQVLCRLTSAAVQEAERFAT